MFWVFVKKLWYRIYAGLFILSKNERKKFRKEQTLKAERKYLKRYLHILNGIDKNPAYSEEERNIWVCWFQGEAQAPEIVKRCLESIRQNANGCKVVLIDNENIKKYADIPDYIFEKRRKRLITPMQFSDILRATLLADRGGVCRVRAGKRFRRADCGGGQGGAPRGGARGADNAAGDWYSG